MHSVSTLEKELEELQKKRLKSNTNLYKYRRFFDIKLDSDSSKIESFVMKHDYIESILSYMVFFVLMSSEEMTAEDAIVTYRSRDNIEKFFSSVKSGMDFDRPAVHNDIRLASKVF